MRAEGHEIIKQKNEYNNIKLKSSLKLLMTIISRIMLILSIQLNLFQTK